MDGATARWTECSSRHREGLGGTEGTGELSVRKHTFLPLHGGRSQRVCKVAGTGCATVLRDTDVIAHSLLTTAETRLSVLWEITGFSAELWTAVDSSNNTTLSGRHAEGGPDRPLDACP